MYAFNSSLAKQRWSDPRPCRVINRDLGYPITVVDDQGDYVRPLELDQDKVQYQLPLQYKPTEDMRVKLAANYCAKLYNAPGIQGIGVFADQDLKKGEYIGPYCGLVRTYEESEELAEEGHFEFALNDGAQGVVLDGEYEACANELKYINHSCSPNILMREVFSGGSWSVIVEAMCDISKGQELCHDFALVTEDEEKAKMPCLCKAPNCRGTLFRYVEWD